MRSILPWIADAFGAASVFAIPYLWLMLAYAVQP